MILVNGHNHQTASHDVHSSLRFLPLPSPQVPLTGQIDSIQSNWTKVINI